MAQSPLGPSTTHLPPLPKEANREAGPACNSTLQHLHSRDPHAETGLDDGQCRRAGPAPALARGWAVAPDIFVPRSPHHFNISPSRGVRSSELF